MVYAASMLWGILTAVVLFFVTPLLLLGELAGPARFGLSYVFLSIIGLVMASLTTRAERGVVGLLCGLAFTSPLGDAFYVICRVEPDIQREHGGELAVAACVMAALSMVVMGCVACCRKTARLRKDAAGKDMF